MKNCKFLSIISLMAILAFAANLNAYAGETISTDNLKSAAGTSSGSGSEKLYFQWTTNETDGNIEFKSTESSEGADYTYSYSEDAQYVGKTNDTGGGSQFYGGALNNKESGGKNYDEITDDFVGNHILNPNKDVVSGGILGGAIYNQSHTIESLSGDFIGNYINPSVNSGAGGAVANTKNAVIKSITGNFIGNYVDESQSSNASGNGGAIYNFNQSIIGEITSKFIGNYVIGSSALGGAIINQNASIQNITDSEFIGNYVKSIYNKAAGGAIANHSTNGDAVSITNTKFTSNYAMDTSNSEYQSAVGGAIANGDNTSGNENPAHISSIASSLFENNYAATSHGTAQGGAIYNEIDTYAVIDNITETTFTGNYAESGDLEAEAAGAAMGGAIANLGTISTIADSEFSKNYAQNNYTGSPKGGAIYNSGTIGSIINSQFSENYVTAHSGDALGGAIYNEGTVTASKSSFTNNYAESGSGSAYGGAIYTTGTVNIKAEQDDAVTFSGNYAKSGSGSAYGGAIYTTGTVNIKAEQDDAVTFSGNYAKSGSGSAYGGAIYAGGGEVNITADGGTVIFTGNKTISGETEEQNAIYAASDSAAITLKAENSGTITFDDTIDGTSGYSLNMTGDSTGVITLNNLVKNASAALDTTILKIGVMDENGNTASGNSDVFKTSGLNVQSGTVDVADNSYTNYNMQKLTSSFDARYNIDMTLSSTEQSADTFTVGGGSSGTIYLKSVNVLEDSLEDEQSYVVQIIKSENDDIQLDYDESKWITQAQALMDTEDILAKEFGLYTTDTENDSIIAVGLRNTFTAWAELEVDDATAKVFTLLNSDSAALIRDAGLNGEDITIIGANNNTLDLGNYTFLDTISDSQQVSISNVTITNSNDIENSGTLSLDSVTLSDNTAVTNQNTLNISGKTSLSGVLTNNSETNITNAEITFDNIINGTDGKIDVTDSTVNLNNSVSGQTFTVSETSETDGSTNVNLADVTTFKNNSLYMNSGNFNITDLGLNSLVLNTFDLSGGNINIGNVNVDLANQTMGQIRATNYSSASGTINVNGLTVLSDSKDYGTTPVQFVESAMKNTVSSSITEAVGPIYKYDVGYSSDGTYGENGYFTFTRTIDNNGGSTPAFDDFSPSVFTGSVASQVGGFLTASEVLQQSFYHMGRYTKYRHSDRVAAEMSNRYASLEPVRYQADCGCVLPEISKSVWVNPYTSFEKVNLKGGVGVSNIGYGTLVGGDSYLYDLGHGYKGIMSAFIGYNGSHQSYNGISMNQNGGTLGFTGTVYKGNFFTGLTASAGASAGQAYTPYGTDNFSMLMAGAASKSGYNFEFKEGKYIIQPTLYLGYTFVNTFDYTNAAGVRMDSDPLHAIQIIPGLTFIGNLKNGWQPYASVNMVWNVMTDKQNFTANDVRLPQLSVKPYVQYGVGIQKTWKDRFTGFLQAMVRNGGRNGIALQAGFRWALGKDIAEHSKHAAYNIPELKKTVIKLSSQAR